MDLRDKHRRLDALPFTGEEIQTACGGKSEFNPETPWAWYQGQRVYFCTQDCKRIFEEDVEKSCLFVNQT